MPNERPNIVLITTDQQRFDTWGRFAPPFMRTPHLNHLAADGITFTRAYADCPVCVPARVAYMTGRSVFAHGMGTNAPTCDYFGAEDTLPAVLRGRGYQTYAIGKLHFHPQRIRHGFDGTITLDDYYRGMARSGSPLQPRRHGLGENEFYAGMATVPEAMTLTSWITEQAVEFLAERRDPTTPFFLWVSYSKPHPPLDPPEPYYSMYLHEEIPEPWVGDWAEADDRPEPVRKHQQAQNTDRMSPSLIRSARAAYYGLITQIDYNIGRIIGALQDTGCFFSPRDDTMILFCSDHGEYLGDHRMLAKDTFHEGSAHVPMILRLPRTWSDRPVGVECDHLAAHQDILSTFAAAAGGEAPETSEGVDLVGLLGGDVHPREHLFAAQGFNLKRPDGIHWVGVTDGRWKYTWYYVDGTEQLFDIETDPHELHDLARAPKEKDVRRALRGRIVEHLARHGGQFLKDGELFRHPFSPPDEHRRRSSGFPGFMRDTHRSDALH